MQRLLLASLMCAAASCASNAASKPGASSTTAQPAGTVCNDEVYSPRGTVGERCYTKEQLDNQKRFTSDRKLDPTPRQTYNNN